MLYDTVFHKWVNIILYLCLFAANNDTVFVASFDWQLLFYLRNQPYHQIIFYHKESLATEKPI